MSVSSKPFRMKSMNVAIGAAAGFAALSACLALVPEPPSPDVPRSWALRGTIQPTVPDAPARPQRQARL